MGILDKYTGIIRSFKAVYVVNNIVNFKKLAHNKTLYAKYGLRKSIFSPISHKNFRHLPPQPAPWLDAPDAPAKLAATKALADFPAGIQEQLQNWPENGFLALRNFFDGKTVDSINQEIDRLLQEQQVDFNYTNRKIMFAFNRSEVLKAILYTPALNKVLEFILGRKVIPFQTINFLKGSEQRAHSDSIHMTTYPLGNLIAVWIALEDTDEHNGPLFYYPGSHKLPYILNESYDSGSTRYRIGNYAYRMYEEKVQEVISQQKLEKKTFYAKKGDVFIWHANLLHGGSPVLDLGRNRKSMVIHYYAADVISYHEITQRPALFSNYPTAEIKLYDND